MRSTRFTISGTINTVGVINLPTPLSNVVSLNWKYASSSLQDLMVIIDNWDNGELCNTREPYFAFIPSNCSNIDYSPSEGHPRNLTQLRIRIKDILGLSLGDSPYWIELIAYHN